jgi:hypothetical protein
MLSFMVSLGLVMPVHLPFCGRRVGEWRVEMAISIKTLNQLELA